LLAFNRPKLDQVIRQRPVVFVEEQSLPLQLAASGATVVLMTAVL
jgi:hypothetical protein